jgi:DNA-binding PadR family transcriptional regulator
MDEREHGHERRGESRRRHDSRGMHGRGGMSGQGRMHVRGPMSEAAPRVVARGGIRFAILGMLSDKPRHGYDIIREMEDMSGGLYSPSPGSIYPNLQALEDQDLVTSSTEEGKKVYAITEAGSAYLEQHKERAESHRERWRTQWGGGQEGEAGETLKDIHDAFYQVKAAVRDSAGDADRLKAIGEVLSEAAVKIGAIVER